MPRFISNSGSFQDLIVSGSRLYVASSSIFFNNLTTSSTTVSNVLVISSSGQIYFTASSALPSTTQTIPTPFFIATGSVTASVNVGAGNVFNIISSSDTLLSVSPAGGTINKQWLLTNGGKLTIGSASPGLQPFLEIKNTASPGGFWSLNVSESGDFAIRDNNTPSINAIYIKSGSGNVGIGGITSPNSVLHVSSSFRVTGGNGRGQLTVSSNDSVQVGPSAGNVGNAQFNIYGGTNSGAYMYLGFNSAYAGEIASPASGRIHINPSTDLLFLIGGSEKARINNNGNLLLGTTTDNGTLTVSGSTVLSGSLTTTGSVLFRGLTTSNESNVVTINTSTGQLYYTASSAFGGGSSNPSSLIFSGIVTASVNTGDIGNVFAVYSGSNTPLVRMTNSGTLVLPSHAAAGDFQRNAFVASGSITTGMAFYDHNTMIFRSTGNDIFKITPTGLVSNGLLAFGSQGSPPVIQSSPDTTTNNNNLAITVGTLNKSGSVQLLKGNVLITETYNASGSNYKLEVSGSGTSGSFNANNVLFVSGSNVSISGSFTVVSGSTEFQVLSTGIKMGNSSSDAHIMTGSFRISGTGNTGSILTVIGSGSLNPIFTVQGSQGELFSVTDSLTGSLFSVNDISGLPILDVNSDQTTKIGTYLAPGMYASARVTANTGITVIYSIPTASYDSAYFDYNIRSGSVGRAGSIIAMWSGSSVNYSEVSASSFGTTNTFVLGVSISGSNMILSGSAPTNGWTVKTIVKAI